MIMVQSQVVIETEEMDAVIDSVNKESTISVTGVVRERSSKNKDLATGVRSKLFREDRNFGKNVFTMHFHLKSTSPKMQTETQD